MEFEDCIESVKIFHAELCHWFILFSILVLRVLKKEHFVKERVNCPFRGIFQ